MVANGSMKHHFLEIQWKSLHVLHNGSSIVSTVPQIPRFLWTGLLRRTRLCTSERGEQFVEDHCNICREKTTEKTSSKVKVRPPKHSKAAWLFFGRCSDHLPIAEIVAESQEPGKSCLTWPPGAHSLGSPAVQCTSGVKFLFSECGY